MRTVEAILAQGKENCCGCSACAQACPTGAIRMVPQELGCLYPRVDAQKCIECSACVNTCAMQNGTGHMAVKPDAFAAMAVQERLLKKSASGGVFSALAAAVLDRGGVVWGCSLEETDGRLQPLHICVEDRQYMEKLQGSKYVQSSLAGVFPRVRQQLKKEKLVLFSGTPCQIDALKRYLRREDTANLFTVDLICHGAPSAKLFQEYLGTFRYPIQSFFFRDKTTGAGYTARYTCQKGEGKGETLLPASLSSYYSLFLESEINRESCYACPYANVDRIGDITVGDYWGLELTHPELMASGGGPYAVHKGISAVLVNTDKGKTLLEWAASSLILTKTDLQDVVAWNRQLREPAKHSGIRQKIIEQYARHGYAGVERLWRRRLGLRYPVRCIRYSVRKRKNSRKKTGTG